MRKYFNPLLSGFAFLYPLKTSENLWFSDAFAKYKEETPGSNGLNVTAIAAKSRKKSCPYCLYFDRTFEKWDYICLNGLILQDQK